jgi:isochorismate synthase
LEDSVILEELHPTPAVCGYPRDMAIDTLKDLGMMDRDYYCGFIGFRDAVRSEYYVNLRCMELGDKSAYVFVGGGITAASSPEQEWEELNQKALTMGRILE